MATNIVNPPDLTISSISQPSPNMYANAMRQITVNVANIAGASPATPPIKVTFTLPGTGVSGAKTPLKFSRIADHWVCTRSGLIITCNYDLPLNGNQTTQLRIPINPTGTVANPVFTASVTAIANETNIANNGPFSLTPTIAVNTGANPNLVAEADPVFTKFYSYPILSTANIPLFAQSILNPNSLFF
ncbi:MAG: hypothetical protein ABL933_06520 [Methyloglobulus sp.]|nr:hypothetical protein [Methyloglobulus sp.]